MPPGITICPAASTIRPAPSAARLPGGPIAMMRSPAYRPSCPGLTRLDPGINAMSNNPTCDVDCQVKPGNDYLVLLKDRRSFRTGWSRSSAPNCRPGKGEVFEDFGPRDFVDHKDKTAAPVLVGPRVEPFRREHRMLCRLHHCRPLGPVGKAHDPLDSEQVGAALASESAQRAGEVETAEITFKNQTKGVDAVSVGGDRVCRHGRSSRSVTCTE